MTKKLYVEEVIWKFPRSQLASVLHLWVLDVTV